MKPDGMKQHIYERYQADGFIEEDIKRIWKDTLYFRAKANINYIDKLLDLAERNDIFGLTSREFNEFAKTEKRLHKEVSDWFGRGR